MDNRRRMLLSGGLSADPVLENNDWATISKVARAGKAAQFWKVGDTKQITMRGTTYTAQIIGFDHDDVTDSASYGRVKAGITFQFKETTSGTYQINSSTSLSGGWAVAGIQNSLKTMYNGLNSDLRSVIVPVNKPYNASYNASSVSYSSDKLFLLSTYEIFTIGNTSAARDGSRYAYYAAGNARYKYRVGTSTKAAYWTRSYYSNSAFFYDVSISGTLDYHMLTTERYVAPGFCV